MRKTWGQKFSSDPHVKVVFILGKFLCKVKVRLSVTQCCGSGSGIGCLFDPGSGMGKKSRSGSGMNVPDHISESLETIFWVILIIFRLKYLNFLMRMRIRIQDTEIFDPGSGINIPDSHHCRYPYISSSV